MSPAPSFSSATDFIPSDIIHVILEVLMNLPGALAVVGKRPTVNPDALADNVRVVRRRADAHRTSGSPEHVTKIVGDRLQFHGCTLMILLPEYLVKKNRVVRWASRPCVQM